jgi:hypothetical protein
MEETKCTCKACGNIWYYGKKEAIEAKLSGLNKFGDTLIRIGQGGMAWLIPENKKDLVNKCPRCNSSAIAKEQITHEV